MEGHCLPCQATQRPHCLCPSATADGTRLSQAPWVLSQRSRSLKSTRAPRRKESMPQVMSRKRILPQARTMSYPTLSPPLYLQSPMTLSPTRLPRQESRPFGSFLKTLRGHTRTLPVLEAHAVRPSRARAANHLRRLELHAATRHGLQASPPWTHLSDPA